MAAFYLAKDNVMLPRLSEAFPRLKPLDLMAGPASIDTHTLIWAFVSHTQDLRLLKDSVLSKYRDARVVVLSNNPSPPEALQAFKTGARGYCHAQSTPKLFRRIAKAVSNGGFWVGPEFMSLLLQGVGVAIDKAKIRRPDTSKFDTLTTREREVAAYVCDGASNKEIARVLGITERTIKAHLTSIFGKLGIRDRLQMAIQLKPLLVDSKKQ